MMKRLVLGVGALMVSATAAVADMTVALGGGWDGKTIPAGQQCTLFGGNGATPPMQVTDLPQGTAWVFVEFNDRDFRPLSKNGGHGVIAYPASGASAELYAVPGLKGTLPGAARVISAARSTGDYASPGYLPPCSGGQKHRYQAVVKAVSADGKVLAQERVALGRY